METIDLLIERLGINGEGVGHHDGYTIFVPGVLPGEKGRARFFEKKKTYGKAKLEDLLSTSPHRVTPPCPLFGKCGGCQLMHLAYPQQLEMKRQRVIDALERIGKFQNLDVLPCEPSPRTLGYRNKIQLPFGKGLYAHNTHEIVEVEHCHIHCDLGEKALQTIRPFLERLPPGELKTLLIKTAIHTEQVLVTLVTQSENPPFLGEVAKQILASMPQIRGVVQNVNGTEGNTILGKTFKLLAGEPAIWEVILGIHFKISSASFFQVNPAQAEKLYAKVVEAAALKGNERVLDAYCGVGTLSLLLARQAKEVIGIECVSEAIEDAKENAKRNGLSNVEFHCAQAEKYLLREERPIDVAILNPPRKGCESSFLEKLASLNPKRLVYVSCDPATLARDLALLAQKGYQIDTVQPFDMFPQTAHVECLVKIRNSKFEIQK